MSELSLVLFSISVIIFVLSICMIVIGVLKKRTDGHTDKRKLIVLEDHILIHTQKKIDLESYDTDITN